MVARIEREFMVADLAAVESLIGKLPPTDIVSRVGLERRRDEIREQLASLQSTARTLASAAIFFGGQPVVGSLGIESSFGADAITKFQDIVSKAYGARTRSALGQRGPVPDKERSKLYVTQIVHGSFGFLFEELDDPVLFDSDLKESVDQAIAAMATFDDPDDEAFAAAVEDIDDRVLASIRGFFELVQARDATFRIVSDAVDKHYNTKSIGQAITRAASTQITEREVVVEGQLLGILPEKREFEYRTETKGVIRGRVAMNLTSDELSRLNVDFIPQRSKASLRVREISRQGSVYHRASFLLAIEPSAPLGGETTHVLPH